jgi:hypothetical protein
MRRVWFDGEDQPYYELVCDSCGTSMLCWDDSCDDWLLLCGAARFGGWSTGGDVPTGPHHCPDCAAAVVPSFEQPPVPEQHPGLARPAS